MKIIEIKEINKRINTNGNASFEVVEFRVDYTIDELSGYEYITIELNENNELVSNIDDNSIFSDEQKEVILKAVMNFHGKPLVRYTLLPFLKLNQRQKNIVNKVYEMLKNSEVYPSGMTKANKFYADNSHLISCRAPSRAFPYSELNACRTKKYVAKVLQYYNCKSVKTLLKHI
ncbi:hypothetical protein PVK64_14910 [Aliivibrio sp. S4TY2]|uniref:Uncharacterized protein n=2 Tax=Aliivibrio TaxID=511678 RepID=A0A4Q5KKJ7_9GAMM|nr:MULTISPECIES: hypothetical protein [Aliivibrio]MDD9157462.1 hypothetical protein [Aliivibrio sp. S4TY2]MDD9161344.1 hypothetical protein [Aliivibrio sp. S4TY1]MDD9165374.1 hypothetical protein [Aliivibrio sp. S4MY2]MDD9169371.1 hypothetical protein [Aliivibrio sp. S4MY4]MDD9186364.1 hypothetical protein [Aliivibrio sp. S4MY3]